MLAVDTNLVLRYLLGDHPSQSAKARALIEGNEIFVCTTVLLETEWVLRSFYDFKPMQVAEALTSLAGVPGIRFQDAVLTAKALDWMAKGADFADAMHYLASEGCDAFVTFDARLARKIERLGEIPVRTL
jgi:predicted nucleic-acid-binding protein